MRLLRPADAAARIGITPETLRKWRNRAQGPAYVHMPTGYVRYREADLDAWIAGLTSNAVDCTYSHNA
jgi:predicted DNA-binding transcriptional regulator AlpA